MIIHPDFKSEYLTEERCFILELLNSERNANISVARARVEPGVTTALHALEADEIYYILEGQGIAEVDGSKTEVGPNDLVVIEKRKTQRITNTGDADLIFLCICQPRFTTERYTSLE